MTNQVDMKMPKPTLQAFWYLRYLRILADWRSRNWMLVVGWCIVDGWFWERTGRRKSTISIRQSTTFDTL